MRSFIKSSAVIVAAAFLATAGVATSQEADGKGSVFVAPPPDADLLDAEDDLEITSDLELFERAGYTVPDFNTYYNMRHEVGSEIVGPDYAKRTGKIAPEDTRVEVAAVYLTGGDFNDLVIYSFLPGDCGIGCLTQVYRTVDGLKWTKVIEFKSLSFAYKPAEGEKPSEIVAVGGPQLPNRIFTWDGAAFREK